MFHTDENQIFIRDSLEPLTDVSSVQLVFALILFLLLECSWFIKLDFTLFSTTVHANLALQTRTFFDDVFDDLLEFS